MATQSLYRRYRPRRFSEVKGQDHVVLALRNAVAEGRAGQAYLFSGPRGTGKTTSARILAKVLNCKNPVDGEPCCECDSCLAVDRGTSYDVHELDAASNNGVDAMRDLIEKASLGTPGRHKVYILDEVHMLSKAAEAALLKTLEEPPNHVVFVLATTDPQKMSDTIRSRTQHLQFHLLPADTLGEHVRWVAADAGLDVSDEAIGHVLSKGGGSARDALSALELVSTTGGKGAETVPVGEFVEALIDADPARALAMIAQAIALGSDPRTLTEELIGHLRNGFLSLMAPDVVQLPGDEVEAVAEQAGRLGPPGLVRGIEVLGAALAEMRHAPDPRVLLDVAAVQLSAPSSSSDVGALAQRLERLERQFAAGDRGPSATGGDAPAPAATAAGVAGRAGSDDDRRDPSTGRTRRGGPDGDPRDPSTGRGRRGGPDGDPRDPSTGRATLGGRAKRAAAVDEPTPEPADRDRSPGTTPAGQESTGAPAGADGGATAPAESAETGSPDRPPATSDGPAGPGDGPSVPGEPAGSPPADRATEPVASSTEVPPGSNRSAEPVAAARPASDGDRGDVRSGPITAEVWDGTIKPSLRRMARAVYAPVTFVEVAGGAVRLAVPNQVHRDKCEQHRDVVGEALSAHAGTDLTVELVVGGPASDGPSGATRTPEPEPETGDDIDLDDLVDAPPESVKPPIERLAEAFPGSEMVEERD